MSEILNSSAIDTWLFDHSQNQGHVCKGVKDSTGKNIAWVDTNAFDYIVVEYADTEAIKAAKLEVLESTEIRIARSFMTYEAREELMRDIDSQFRKLKQQIESEG
jgi:hypothetical protein